MYTIYIYIYIILSRYFRRTEIYEPPQCHIDLHSVHGCNPWQQGINLVRAKVPKDHSKSIEDSSRLFK